ncbi:hypothetical protein [Silvimonas sp.]|uniref:hypothetical protein n=1 Tax=Silvimonas sp. TaxID=2650811 RepID=UPI00284BDF67|nr:hypothetical protein [Silvimonas sp.]MDR3428218.1 hypothetical protein [Silvimonas sp.]
MTPKELLTLIEFLKVDHNPDIALKVIQHFHDRMQADELLPDEKDLLCMWMQHVFPQVLAKKNANVAFGLEIGQGEHSRTDTTARDQTAAACVVLLMRRGKRWQEAIGDAANLLFRDGEGGKAVERAYAKYKGVFTSCPNEFLYERLLPHQLPS